MPKRNHEPIPFKDSVLTLELSELESGFTQVWSLRSHLKHEHFIHQGARHVLALGDFFFNF